MRDSSIDLKGFYKTIMQKSPLAYGHQFIVTFSGTDLPADIQNGSDYTSITYYVKSSVIPKVEIDESKVSFLSQQFVVPKQVKFDGNWNVNVLLDQNLRHYRSLYHWQNEFSSLQLSGGGRKIIPSVQAHVGLLDATLQHVIHRFTLEGVFPTEIPDLSMTYENQSNIVDFPCKFVYQYLYDEDNGNPLDANSK